MAKIGTTKKLVLKSVWAVAGFAGNFHMLVIYY